MTLMNKLARFGRTPQARRMTQKAMNYAQSPEGKRRIAAARGRVAKRGKVK